MENIWDLLRSCDRLICPKNIDTTAALDDQIFATIHKAYFWGLCKWISPQNMAWNMVLTYLLILGSLKFPLTSVYNPEIHIPSGKLTVCELENHHAING